MHVISPRVSRRPTVDAFDLSILLTLAGLSVWVLCLDLWQVLAHGKTWTGTDGVFLVDQMTYLAWIQDASHHVLVSNLFMLGHSPSDFFEPLIAISGAMTAIGVAPWLALLVWQPVAVIGLFFAVRAYVFRSLGTRPKRRAALVLALFFIGWGAFVAESLVQTGIVARLQLSAITNDLWLGFWSWGYPFGLIALTATLTALVIYDHNRPTNRVGWLPPVLGALASSVHPWQGGTLVLVLIGAEAIEWRRGESPRIRCLMPTLVATVLPAIYFTLLNHLDPSWKLAQTAASGSFPLWMVALTVVPLALPAALAYRVPPKTYLALTTRLWPLAAVVLFFISETGLSAAPTHALLGISIPLGILAVEGVGSLRLERRLPHPGILAAMLISVVLAPPIAYEMSTARRLTAPGPLQGQASGPGDANFVSHSEREALTYLAQDPTPGGVLTRFYLGTVVPGLTGRPTYVGNPYYSPDYFRRIALTDELFLGVLGPSAARAEALNTRARFLLADCRSPSDLSSELAPISRSVHRFGCATVFVTH